MWAKRMSLIFASLSVIQVESVTRENIADAISATGQISLPAGTIDFSTKVAIGDAESLTVTADIGAVPVLDGKNLSPLFNVEWGGTLILRGITLQNGLAEPSGAGRAGGAIYSNGGIVLEDCTFSDNVAANNGGAICSFGTFTARNCIFSGNSGQGGGAIFQASFGVDPEFDVTGCTFSNNQAQDPYFYNSWLGDYNNYYGYSGGDDILVNAGLSKFSLITDGAATDAFCATVADSETGEGPCPLTTRPAPTAAPTASPTAAPSEGSKGDPHLQLADGGFADFRGTHNGIYNMLTSQGISVNALFREQDFYLTASGVEFVRPGSMKLDKLLVHGTFIFEVYTIVRTSSGRLLQLRTEATANSAANVAVIENNVPVSKLSANEERIIDNVELRTKDGRVVISTPEWVVQCVVVRAKEAHFLNLSFRHLTPGITKSTPHGIIGQSYDYDGIAVDGAKDVYPTAAGGEFTTTAQAEGAIEGIHSDYLMESPFATAYKYTRFNNKAAKARDIRKLAGKKRRSIDPERRKLAMLLQRMAGKDNFVGAE